MQRGQYAAAAVLLAPLAATNPTDADLQYRLGLAYQRSGDLTAAAAALTKAAQLRPNEATYAAALARLYAAIPRADRASFWYRKLLHLRPDSPGLAAEAATFLLQQKQTLEAELLLKQALTAHPKSPDLWLLLAQTYAALGLVEEQANSLEKAARLKALPPAQLRQLTDLYLQVGQPDRALPHLQNAARRQPKDAALQAQLAACHLAVSNRPAALAAYRAAAQLAPDVPAYRLAIAEIMGDNDPAQALAAYDAAFRLQQPSAEQLLAAAALAAKAGDRAAQRRYLTMLIALTPQDVEPRERLIQAALTDGDHATAALQWRELQTAGHAPYGVPEAELALRLGAREWALGRLEVIADRAAGQPEVLAQTASLFLQLHDTARAAALARAALAQTTNWTEARGPRLLAAQVLRQANQPDDAEPVFAEVLAADPKHPTAARGLALCLLQRGQVRRAWELLRTALQDHPRDPQIVSALLQAAEAADELETTALLLRQLLQSAPDNGVVLDGLRMLYRRQGNELLAARKLAELAEAQPHAPLIALMAARELAATGHAAEAVAFYERVAQTADFAAAGRAGLCDVLLSQGRYADLLAALARLTTPRLIGPEGYRLLRVAQGEDVAWAPDPTGSSVSSRAHAAAALCLASPASEAYYLSLADLYLALGPADEGVTFLTAEANRKEVGPAATVGLAHLLRETNRPQEALVWLDRLGGSAPSPAALLERAQALLAVNRITDAGIVAEQVLRMAPVGQALLPAWRAHEIAGEACALGSRPEEALWHFIQALMGGGPREALTRRLAALGASQPLTETAVLNALQQLSARGYTTEALQIADTLAANPAFRRLRDWAMDRARSQGTSGYSASP
jgi:predicted Zn-dependent protease